MSLETEVQQRPEGLTWRLATLYGRWGFRYLLMVVVLWWLGVEALYEHPTPFYALIRPSFKAFLTPFTMLALFGAVALAIGFYAYGGTARRRLYVGLAVWVLYVALVVAPVAWVTFSPQMPWQIPSKVVAQDLGMHLLAFGIFLACWGGLCIALRRLNWFEEELTSRETTWMLAGAIFFVFAFSGAVAMLREGTAGIADAYTRYKLEYVGDIGIGGSIRGLFHEYVDKHQMFSAHGKVHPPGPIALLWILSFLAETPEGRDLVRLSLATMAVGSIAVIPLYFWAKDLLGRRVALTACLLYSVVPSIVLFTATSADILFMPFTLTTLFLFGRALDRSSVKYAIGAGLMYALASLMSFSLLALGVYFGLMGLWRLRDPRRRFAVFQTAVVMLAAFVALHIGVWLWSGFEVVEAFRLAKAQFDRDQVELQALAPRFSAWSWRFFNPLAWLYFAGIPVSVLFIWRLWRPQADTKVLFVVFALTLLGLDLLYLARGEGERSAMYVFPFLVLPAAHMLDKLGRTSRRISVLAVTLAALAFQCWFTETFFYTYW